MDADLSHNPKIIPIFLKNLRNYDLVIGSRYIAGGKIRNWELWRRFLSRIGNFYAHKVLNTPIHDLTSGFMAINSKNLEKINLKSIRSDGYAFMIELKFHLFRQGARTKEIPIEFVQRKIGSSKISANIIKEGLIMPWNLKFKR
jgi:dolichol-phosphate mannosyltransferase